MSSSEDLFGKIQVVENNLIPNNGYLYNRDGEIFGVLIFSDVCFIMEDGVMERYFIDGFVDARCEIWVIYLNYLFYLYILLFVIL